MIVGAYILFTKPSESSTNIGEIAISLGINNVYEENGNLVVNVTRNAGGGQLTGIKFILSAGGNYIETIIINSSLQESGKENFVLTPTQLSLSEIKNIFIVPIFESSDKKEVVGKITDTHSFSSSGSINPVEKTCTPNCVGLQCGLDSVCGQLCGECSGTDTCTNGVCVPKTCIPNSNISTCGSSRCGAKINNCGQQVNCGSCDTNYKCQNNNCIAQTCQEKCRSAGKTCGTYQSCSCGVCNIGQECTDLTNGGTCRTCTDNCISHNYNCGNYNFCGVNANCGSLNGNCPTGQTCQQGSCNCPTGYTVLGDSCIKSIEINTCGSLIKTGDASKNLDIVFLSLDKLGSNLNQFQLDLNKDIDYILSAEPFKSKKDSINFYFLKVDESFWYGDNNQYVNYTRIFSLLAAKCGNVDEIIQLMNQGGGTAGSHIATAPSYYLPAMLHEFGHSFGGLGDTYIHAIFYDGNPGINVGYFPNTDTAGCPKWCQSNIGSYQTACTLITNGQECRHHERTLNENGNWSCQKPGSSTNDDISKCCVWLSTPDPFFGTRCVDFRDSKDIGVNCVGNSGCFYGAFGVQGVWRSVGSTYNDGLTDDIMNTRDLTNVHEFGIVEINSMNDIFDCCYPRTCNNYPQQKCHQLASIGNSLHPFQRLNLSRGAGSTCDTCI